MCECVCLCVCVCALYCWFWKSNFDLNWFLLAHFSNRGVERVGKGGERKQQQTCLSSKRFKFLYHPHTHTMLNISDSGHHILIHYETMRKDFRGDSLVAFCCFHLHSAALQCVSRTVCVCMGVCECVRSLKQIKFICGQAGGEVKWRQTCAYCIVTNPPPTPYLYPLQGGTLKDL